MPSPTLTTVTYAMLSQKLHESIKLLDQIEGHYLPVAVVQIIQEQYCTQCDTPHYAHSPQLHLRCVNRKGDSWTRPMPPALIPPHLPREQFIRKQQINTCINCYLTTNIDQLNLFTPEEIQAEFPIFDANGEEIDLEFRRLLARRQVTPNRTGRPASRRLKTQKTQDPKVPKPMTIADL